MNVFVMAPLTLVIVGVIAGSFLPCHLNPRRATQALTAAVVLAAVAMVTALAQVTLAGLSEIPAVAHAIGWCSALYGGAHGASPIFGLVAGAFLLAVAAGAGRYALRVRSEMAVFSNVAGVEVIDMEGPVAFAVPGRPGGVVIGAGLLRDLDADERAAVLAHESAHLRFHHHRYVRVADFCAAGIPFLRPLARQVRFMTERWADEVAADRVGSRELVATTIARVALMRPASVAPLALGFGGRGIVARVDALMNPTSTSFVIGAFAATGVVALVALSSGLQVHHLAQFFAHVCGA